MNLSDLTPTRETCDALEAAGFPQNTAFVWTEWANQSGRPHVALRSADSGIGRKAEHGAPTLSEVLAELPEQLDFALPHPIFGTMERTHTLTIGTGGGAVIGYRRVGVREEQFQMTHERAVEVAARLYLALHAAGRLPASKSSVQVPLIAGYADRLAYAA